MIEINTKRTIRLARRCPLCGRHVEMEFPKDELDAGLQRREAGALLQNAFPTFSPSQREFLHTGTCDECWAKL